MPLVSRLPRLTVAAVLFVACESKDPLDSATNPTAVTDPSAGPGGDMTEGPGSSTTADTGPTTGGTATDPEPTSGGTTTGTTDDDAATATGDPTSGVELSHDLDIQPIWDANCLTGCHTAGGTAASWFVLDVGAAYDEIVLQSSFEVASMVLVQPGDVENSYLWHKINDTHLEVGGAGTAMPPPPAAQLSSAELGKIGQWIEGGCAP
ncbi:hypothetical protein [Nannocystis pusilla]|uniref:Cytochrome c domain-containing protein n=1 Tax=Nannocystis pusilla TaxID=889268 RepID=A0ABS7TJX9_9BACT|nr:hypothetical protein [Nannocystis pusilla]MBZ5708504.1 hypothetical protein [Nannocystis pusilla]